MYISLGANKVTVLQILHWDISNMRIFPIALDPATESALQVVAA